MGKKAPVSTKSVPPKTTKMDERARKKPNMTGKHGMPYPDGKYGANRKGYS